MAQRGGLRKYLYWSERRVRAVAQAHGVSLPYPGDQWDPDPEYAPRRADRNGIALKIEMAAGRRAVCDFARPAPFRYAYGRGTVVFSEFAHEVEAPPMGLAFTDTTGSDGSRVAICLFGGIADLAEVITDVSPQAKGWSTASAEMIADFVHRRCVLGEGRRSELLALAGEALRVATRQGEENRDDDVLARPWKRGFTYGHVRDVAEWFAEIHLDLPTADLPPGATDGCGYDRLLIGLPLWIRTPSLRALTLYDEIPAQELDLDIGRYE